jgi:hypothetical protein
MHYTNNCGMTKKEFEETSKFLFLIVGGIIWLVGKSAKSIKSKIKQKRRNSF